MSNVINLFEPIPPGLKDDLDRLDAKRVSRLLRQFCVDTGRYDGEFRGTYYDLAFDDQTDVEPFLAWISATGRRDQWAQELEQLRADDLGLIRLGLTHEHWTREND